MEKYQECDVPHTKQIEEYRKLSEAEIEELIKKEESKMKMFKKNVSK